MKPPAPHPLIAVSTSPSQPQLVDEHPFNSPLQACLLHSSSIMLLAAFSYAYCVVPGVIRCMVPGYTRDTRYIVALCK